MQKCCHCLCIREYDILARINACYPNDDRPDPVSARVRELIQWGTHDISRLSNINEIFIEKIRKGVKNFRYSNVIVGMEILGKLLESVNEINIDLSSSLTSSILMLLRSRNMEYLEIIQESTIILIKNSNHIVLVKHLKQIVYMYLELRKNSEEINQSLCKIIQNCQMYMLPIKEIFSSLEIISPINKLDSDIIKEVAHCAIPLTISRFGEILFTFLNDNNYWVQNEFVSSFMILLIKEINENCSLPLFFLLLEELQVHIENTIICISILEISQKFIEEIKSFKYSSSAQYDSLIIIFSFILKIPIIKSNDNNLLISESLKLSYNILKNFENIELIKITHSQIWETLPIKTEDKYSVDEIMMMFKFISVYDEAVGFFYKDSMIKSSFRKILLFLIHHKNHPEEIYVAILEYLKKFANINNRIWSKFILPFLFAVQEETVKKQKMKDKLPLHTFIMCVMIDNVGFESNYLKKYINTVIDKRIKSNPPMVDCSLNYVYNYFPNLEKQNEIFLPKNVILFERSKMIILNKRKRQHSAFEVIPIDYLLDIDIRKQNKKSHKTENEDKNILPLVYVEESNDEVEQRTKDEIKKAKIIAINNALKLKLQDKSILSGIYEEENENMMILLNA